MRKQTNGARLGFAGMMVALVVSVTACSGLVTSGDGADEMRGESLTVGFVSAGGAPMTDPHGQLFSETDWARLTSIYDTLTVRDADGAAAPALAESWSSSDDATEWTFELRDDAQFSDGSPVTAADALYSIGRLQEKSAENGGRVGTIDMERSAAPDEHTLRLVVPTPNAELSLALTLGSFVVKADTTDFTKPIGSGPFTLDTLDDQIAVLAANNQWWGDGPGVERLTLRGFTDSQAMAQAVTSGSIDMATGVQPAAAKASEATGVQVSARSGGETVPLLMRVDTPPFDDNKVRRAIKLAIDRPTLIEQIYLGYGTPGRDMIRLDDPEVPSDVAEVSRDVEKARRLLAEAGFPDGFTTTLHTSSAYPTMTPLATAVKQQLAEIGITVEVKEHSPDEYWTTAYGVEPFTVGFYGSTQSFGALVRATVLSDAAYSETGWADSQFDATWTQAMATTDDSARAELIGNLHRQMATEGGWLVWGFGDRLTLYRDNVHGVNESGEIYDLSGITVES